MVGGKPRVEILRDQIRDLVTEYHAAAFPVLTSRQASRMFPFQGRSSMPRTFSMRWMLRWISG